MAGVPLFGCQSSSEFLDRFNPVHICCLVGIPDTGTLVQEW